MPDSQIWKYGDLEFHFEQDALWLIYAESLDGVPRISIPRSKLVVEYQDVGTSPSSLTTEDPAISPAW